MQRFRAAGVCLALTLGAVGLSAQPEDPALEALLTKATWYALDFVNKLSNVVAEERYVQDSSVALPTVPIPGLGGRGNPLGSSMSRPSAKHRELRSDFLIVKSNGEYWEPFRDVFEVDRIPVRDRDERISKLFLKPSADARERASAIADESARYNLGSVRRTINNPVFALIFLQPDLRWHFKFSFGKPDRRMGDDVRVVDYLEEARPTIITGLPGQDMVAYGRFWIETATGRVVKTEVRVDERGVKAILTTVFRADERLGIDVPSEMREDYELSDSHVTGNATYGRFRRFEVKSSEEVGTPEPAAPAPPPGAATPTPAPPPQQ